MSNRNSSSSSIISAIVSGVAVAGAAYLAYHKFKEEQQKQQQKQQLQQLYDQLPSRASIPLSSCKICKHGMQVESSILLGCNHRFHLKCLEADHVYRMALQVNEPYKCPTCKAPVYNDVLESLPDEGRSVPQLKANLCPKEVPVPKLRSCEICKLGMQVESAILLGCNHRFHLKCLEADHIGMALQVNEPYKCPTCKAPVYNDVLESLPDEGRSVPQLKANLCPKEVPVPKLRSCEICELDMNVESSILLGCNHRFHLKCLEADLVYHRTVKKGSFMCFTCNFPVADDIVEAITLINISK